MTTFPLEESTSIDTDATPLHRSIDRATAALLETQRLLRHATDSGMNQELLIDGLRGLEAVLVELGGFLSELRDEGEL
jgi:hypothetical protein